MFDPSTLTLGQVSSALRDFTVVGVLIGASWKSRGVYEAAKNFFKRLTTHMDVMETGMNTLLSNHLVHIERNLSKMAQRQVRASVAEQIGYDVDDAAVIEESAAEV